MTSTASWYACMGLSAVAAAMLLALLVLYVRNMRRAPSAFSRGLVVFAGLFTVEAVGSIAVWWNLSAEYDAGVAVPMMALRALEVIGAGALLWVSWE